MDSKEINKVQLKGILEHIPRDREWQVCEVKRASMVNSAMYVQGNVEVPIENLRGM